MKLNLESESTVDDIHRHPTEDGFVAAAPARHYVYRFAVGAPSGLTVELGA